MYTCIYDLSIYICMNVCMYVCMLVCTNVGMYKCMYICILSSRTYACIKFLIPGPMTAKIDLPHSKHSTFPVTSHLLQSQLQV